MCWNARGLKRHTNNFEFKQCILKHDIICITETWSDTLDEFKDIFDGFTCYANIRNFMGRGGVLVLIRRCKGIKVEAVNQKFADFVFLVINSKVVSCNRFILGCIYIAPENSVFYNYVDETNGIGRLENALNDLIGQYGEIPLFLAGDFNSRTACESDYIIDDSLYMTDDNIYLSDSFNMARKSKDKVVNAFGVSLLLLCKIFSIIF